MYVYTHIIMYTCTWVYTHSCNSSFLSCLCWLMFSETQKQWDCWLCLLLLWLEQPSYSFVQVKLWAYDCHVTEMDCDHVIVVHTEHEIFPVVAYAVVYKPFLGLRDLSLYTTRIHSSNTCDMYASIPSSSQVFTTSSLTLSGSLSLSLSLSLSHGHQERQWLL